MRWLCRLGWHRWECFPQATELAVLERGGVEAYCSRCRTGRIIWPDAIVDL